MNTAIKESNDEPANLSPGCQIADHQTGSSLPLANITWGAGQFPRTELHPPHYTELNPPALALSEPSSAPGASVSDDNHSPDNGNLSLNNDNLHTKDASHANHNRLSIKTLDAKITINCKKQNFASGLSSHHLELARKLISASLRTRRFRVDSFVAQLTPDQLGRVVGWVLSDDPISDVRDRIAAAPPDGFGIEVHANTLYRFRNLTRNTELNQWIANTMDAACDILDSDTTSDTAPVREAISQLLHSRLMTQCRKQADPRDIERVLTSIVRLEKLKLLGQRQPRSDSPAATRHKVELSFVTRLPPSSHGQQLTPTEGSGGEQPFHRYSIAPDAESI